MEHGRRIVRGFGAAICCVGVASCATDHPQSRVEESVRPSASVVSNPSSTASWPMVVVAQPYSYGNPGVGPQLSFGVAVLPSDIGSRSSDVGGVIYGLADERDFGSVNYPAISRDGGRSWTIDGPVFHIAAADGAAGVNTVTAVSATTAYAYGGGGNYIRFTTDGGRQWWGAFFEDSVDGVSFGRGIMSATLFTEGPTEPTYISHDDGRTWRLQPPMPRTARPPRRSTTTATSA